MKTKTFSLSLSLLVVVLLSLVTIKACNTVNDFESEVTTLSLQDELLSMISLHNQGLDFVRTGLKDKLGNNHDHLPIELIAQDLTSTFFIKQKEYQRFHTHEIYEMVRHSFQMGTDFDVLSKSRTGHQGVLQSVSTYFDYDLATTTISTLSEIETIILSNDQSLEQSISLLNQIINEISFDTAKKPKDDIDILVLLVGCLYCT